MAPSGVVFVIPTELVDQSVGPNFRRESHINYILRVLGVYVARWFSKH